MAQRPMFLAAMVETLFDVTKPDSSMQNPAAIHITRKPITKKRKEFRIQAVSSETSALATDDKNKTLKWLKELGNPYSSIAIDNDGRIAIDWGVYGIPETFIVDSKSIIQYRHVGPITKNAYKKISKIIDDTK